jgi:hypothetical protein
MGKACLPIGSDTVIGRVPVPNQDAFKTISENTLCDFARTMTINMEESEIFIPGKPCEMSEAIVSPGGFIGGHGDAHENGRFYSKENVL